MTASRPPDASSLVYAPDTVSLRSKRGRDGTSAGRERSWSSVKMVSRARGNGEGSSDGVHTRGAGVCDRGLGFVSAGGVSRVTQHIAPV